MPEATQALVYNIQRYSLHDGPGIRTVVFLKGCPLRCRWCCNPESQAAAPEMSYVGNRCLGREACGLCGEVCPQEAVSFRGGNTGISLTDRARCTNCLACARVCPNGARKIEGVPMTVAEILARVERDEVFFRQGQGGLTVSGGEPLMQGGFLVELLAAARTRRIHTVIETCGFGPYEVLQAAAQHLNEIVFDIKTLDPEKHLAFTGQSNEGILRNFERLGEARPDLPKLVRIPVVPGFNDRLEDIGAILDFLRGRPNIRREVLAYHRYGEGKYSMLDRKYSMGQKKLNRTRFAEMQKLVTEENNG